MLAVACSGSAPPLTKTVVLGLEVNAGPMTPTPIDWIAVAGKVDDMPFFTTNATEGKVLHVTNINLAGTHELRGIAVGASADGMHLAQATAMQAFDGEHTRLIFTLGDDALVDEPLPGVVVTGASGPALSVDHPLVRLTASPDTPATADVLISNVGDATAPLALTLAAPTQELSMSGCGSGALLSGTSCKLHITLTPTQAQSGFGGVIFVNPGSTDAQTILVASTRVPDPMFALTPSSLDFGQSLVDKPNSAQTVHVTNRGGVETSPLTISLRGNNPDQFAIDSDNCSGKTLTPGATCDVGIKPVPKGTGSIAATVVVSADKGGAVMAGLTTTAAFAQGITLSGTTDLGAVVTKSETTSNIVTVKNVGVEATGKLTVTLPTNSVGKALMSSTDTCSGQSLGPGQSCQFAFYLLSLSAGTFAGTLTVAGSEGATASQQVTAEMDDQIATITYDGQSVIDNGYYLFPSMAPPGGQVSHTIVVTNVASSPLLHIGLFRGNDTCASLAPKATCTITTMDGPYSFGSVMNAQVFLEFGGSNVSFHVGRWYSDLQLSAMNFSSANGASQTLTIKNLSSKSVGPISATVEGGSGVTATSHCTTLAANSGCTIDLQLGAGAFIDDVLISAPGEGSFKITFFD